MKLSSAGKFTTINAVALLLCAVLFGNFGVEGTFFSISNKETTDPGEPENTDQTDGFTSRTGGYWIKRPISAPTPYRYDGDDYFYPESKPVTEAPKMPTPYSNQYTPYVPPPPAPNVKPTERPTPRPTLRPTPDPTPGPTLSNRSNPYGASYPVSAPVVPKTPEPTRTPTFRPTVSSIDQQFLNLFA